MNKWIRKSINLIKSKGYLDRLLEIYPPNEIIRDKISEKESKLIENLFQEKKCSELVKILIDLKKKGFKFPIENSYIGFLTHDKDAIDKNPITVQKICDKLFIMRYEELKERLEAPKKASRRIGPMFKSWLKNKFVFVDSDKFSKSHNEIVFLNGNDKFLKSYAVEQLNCKFRELSKGLDFIAKYNDIYIIGTAKFITDFGGSQDNQFNEAISLVKETYSPKKVKKVALIDGVAWLEGNMKSILQKLKEEEFCFSALLLESFIKQLI